MKKPDKPPSNQTQISTEHSISASDLPGFRLVIQPRTQAEKDADERLTAYRRQYWQQYKHQKKRVFGTLAPTEYAALLERADISGRSLWAQLLAEAEAYRSRRVVPTQVIEEQQRNLLIELRRIGNNINQLTRMGHVRVNRRSSGLQATVDQTGVGDARGQEVAVLFERLEQKINDLSSGI